MSEKPTQAIPCQFCEGEPTREKCSNCKKIYKEQMARLLQEKEKIYISERNHGGKKKVNISKENLYFYLSQGKSLRKIAQEFQVSAQTISRLRRKYNL